MGTVRDLVTAALLDLGAIASGETPNATEAADALRRLNLLIETWRLESLMVYALDTVTHTLTGASSYTWGPGGNINTTRPVKLERASQRRTASGQTQDYPLEVLTDQQYEGLFLKSLVVDIASWIYLDRAYPLATLRTYPVLPAGDTLVLYPWHPLTAFASLDATIAFPPGYELALQTNLSIELSSSYRDSTITEALAAQATRSKALIKTVNTRPRTLRLPAGLPTGRVPGGTSRAGFLSGGNT